MTSFENRRRALLRQMLPHTWIGHPIAQALVIVGQQNWADNIHYWTLPARTKCRMKGVKPRFNPDRRLRSMDLVFTPLCSLLRAFGQYRLADSLFRIGPHEVATELGACGYYYDPSPEEKRKRIKEEAERRAKQIVQEEQEKIAEPSLEKRGYTKQTCRRRNTYVHTKWVWVCPEGHTPTQEELLWIALTGHRLKGSPEEESGYEFED